MLMKLHRLQSSSGIIFLLFLCYLIQIVEASVNCQYYEKGQSRPSSTTCPHRCCPNTKPTRLNETCCQLTTVTVISSSSFTVFGYHWWIIFICAICSFTALSIIIHYAKRIHILKHSKHFNSMVDPSSAFKISKPGFNISGNHTMISEQNPPSYSDVASPSPPPPYATMDS